MTTSLRSKIVSAALAAVALSSCTFIEGMQGKVTPDDPRFSNVARAKAYYQNKSGHSVIVTLNASQKKELSAWLGSHRSGWKPYAEEHHPIAKSDIIVWRDDGSAYTINTFSSSEWRNTILIERDPPQENITQSFSSADIESLRRILK